MSSAATFSKTTLCSTLRNDSKHSEKLGLVERRRFGFSKENMATLTKVSKNHIWRKYFRMTIRQEKGLLHDGLFEENLNSLDTNVSHLCLRYYIDHPIFSYHAFANCIHKDLLAWVCWMLETKSECEAIAAVNLPKIIWPIQIRAFKFYS